MPMPLMWIDKVTLESLARHRFRRLRTSVVFSPHLHHTLQGRLVARLSLKIPNAARPSKHTDSALPCTATANSNASSLAHEGCCGDDLVGALSQESVALLSENRSRGRGESKVRRAAGATTSSFKSNLQSSPSESESTSFAFTRTSCRPVNSAKAPGLLCQAVQAPSHDMP